mgnify:CR=1 FL=1
MSRDTISAVAQTLRKQLRESIGLPFREFFTEERMAGVIGELGITFRDRVYSPTVTLLTFVSQVLADRCCRAAVSRVVATVAAAGGRPPSQETGAYCQARNRLPEDFFARMLEETCRAADRELSAEDLWLGRHRVLVADGASAQAPDTLLNRSEWGLPPGVTAGCGFPVVPFVGIFSLLTGMLSRMVIGSKGSHERVLFRGGWDVFAEGDVCLSDRGFCSYVDIALLASRGVHVVMRLFKRRPDFRKGRRLGDEDHIAIWEKPKARPKAMTDSEFEMLPKQLEVRELRARRTVKGWRTREVVIATTLLDGETYSKEALAALYVRRWEVELDFRHIKTTLGMETLSTQSPQSVRKEIMTYMICYNMIRSVMWQAGRDAGEDPLRLSFAGALQHLKSMAPHLGRAADEDDHARLVGILFRLIAGEKLPERAPRFEPRVRKRRPKNYRLMTKPRNVLKQESNRG